MTREEAIRILASSCIPGSKQTEALETLIPELAESEDERIRKALIEVFKKKLEKGFEWVEYGIPNRSVLDWLEKQKEQKPVDYEAELKKCKDNPLYFYDKYVSIKQKPVQTAEEKEYVRTLKGLVSDFIRDCGGGIIDTEYYQKICNWLDGRHIEQKTAWSEEEELMMKAVIGILDESDHPKLCSWLKSIRLRTQ